MLTDKGLLPAPTKVLFSPPRPWPTLVCGKSPTGKETYKSRLNLVTIATVLFVERIYDPLLVSFVKAPQPEPEVQASVDERQSFLQVDRRTCQDCSSE